MGVGIGRNRKHLCLQLLARSRAREGATMHVFGPVLSWSRQMMTTAADRGFDLVAHLVTIPATGIVRREQRHVQAAGPVVGHGRPQQARDTSPHTNAARVATSATTRQSPRQRPVPARHPATAPVTPAMVRRWAHEQGIQVAERGRIPRSVMERYEADAVQPAARTRRNSRGSSTGRGHRSGRSRSSAA